LGEWGTNELTKSGIVLVVGMAYILVWYMIYVRVGLSIIQWTMSCLGGASIGILLIRIPLSHWLHAFT